MIVFLSKFLPLLVLPLGITLILLVIGIVKKRRWLLWTAAIFLWLTSTPLIGNNLSRAMDAGQVRIPAADAPEADAIVVLSTGRVLAPGPAAISEWDDADRFFGGVELFQAGKAPLIVFTGGWFPFAPSAPLEGDILAAHAKAMGVPADRIVTTGRVVNTLEESRAVAALIKTRTPPISRLLLVTSAFHMSRARLLFERAGFTVLPFPVDFGASRAEEFSVLDLVPAAPALVRTQTAMREMYGRLVYRIVPIS
jgi:uncharacterized SAM-binding protein YcdF (DUF218 family)